MGKRKAEASPSRLVAHILSYEADTFSAERSQITVSEAVEVADRLIDRLISFQQATLDGFTLRAALGDVRDGAELPCVWICLAGHRQEHSGSCKACGGNTASHATYIGRYGESMIERAERRKGGGS